MGFTRSGDRITLEMTLEDWERLLLLLGYCTSGAMADDPRWRYRALALVNRLNEGNPNFTPYEVPEEFRDAQGSRSVSTSRTYKD